MRNVELQRNIENAGLEAQYDAYAKKLLSHKIVLAWIMYSCLDEYRDIDPQIIAEKYIEHTQIGVEGVLPGDTAELIHGNSTEDVTPGEHRITYDILFRAMVPEEEELIELILNIEAQNQYHPGYPLETRGIYYCSRMLSSQYGREFQNSEYGKLKKVYSIWICTNPPKDYQNSIATYEMKERLDIGGKPRKKSNYDLMTTVMIGLGNSERDYCTGILKFLGTLLSVKIRPQQKEEILQNEFKIEMSWKMREEVENMCNLSQGILQEGIEQGIEKGIEQGIEQGMVKKAKEMALELYAMGIDIGKIARAAGVSEEQIGVWIQEEDHTV